MILLGVVKMLIVDKDAKCLNQDDPDLRISGLLTQEL
jgi:hypothetical protein